MTAVGRIVAVFALVSVGVVITTARADAAPPQPTTGYWLAGADGGVFSFGAPFYGSGTATPAACGFSPQPPSTLNAAFGCDAIASTPSGNGYWLLNAYRWATAFGQAGQPDQIGCTGLNGAKGSWTGIASSPTGNGFLLASSNGAVVGCGDAVPFGGLSSTTLNAPVVGMTATLNVKGYWMVASDGGVFSFGEAQFYGSMGGTRPQCAGGGDRRHAGWPGLLAGGLGRWGVLVRRRPVPRVHGWDPPQCAGGGDRRHAGWPGLLAGWEGRRSILIRHCSFRGVDGRDSHESPSDWHRCLPAFRQRLIRQFVHLLRDEPTSHSEHAPRGIPMRVAGGGRAFARHLTTDKPFALGAPDRLIQM